MEKLHLSLPNRETSAPEDESKVEDARRLQEEVIDIVFELPDGTEAHEKFRKGQTIAVLKSFLSTEYDIPMTSLKLMHRETILMDPYTITDYSAMEDADNARIQRNEAESFGKKKLGRNVEMFITREDQLHNALRHVKVSEHIKGRAVWEDHQGRRGMINQRHRMDKQIQEEMEMANRELLAIRSERIRNYYTKSYIEWEQQLNARGLAIVRERD
ncbi:hypothetical protein THRCLA_22294 [Thraustotheca clavata]|uniref:Ubiquitin-like domain-containing protein n=1 Tax=Thraustotheca clavata TaxID=74557 RepID=A0A1V9Z6Q3_9STRA|nr:hypothetical protein THRCLA_22294 [Thraustotheca clavata]